LRAEIMQASFFITGDIVNTRNSTGEVIAPCLERLIKAADYSICNFEAPVEGFGKPIIKSGSHIQNKVTTVSSLKKHGFDLLLLANNHMMDYGQEAMQATKDIAVQEGLDIVGAGNNREEAYKPLIKEINCLKFGIVNACEAQFGVLDYHENKEAPGYAWINHNQIDKTIVKLKNECDFVLVFSHAGLENYNVPQKEWRERYKYLCDLGADVIIGCHPHIPQGYEKYNASFIFYSLGNFYFDRGTQAESLNSSFALRLVFQKNKGPIFEPVFHITDIANHQVRLAKENEQINLQHLNQLLEPQRFEEEHTRMTLSAYKNNVNPNMLHAFMPFPLGPTIKSTINEILATLLGRRKHINKPILSLHLIRNETYYFVIRNALELIARRHDSEQGY